MVLCGKTGTQYTLETPCFAQGGEGKIFNVLGHPDKVAKIYNPNKATKELEDKLTYMFNNQPDPSVLIRISWPVDILMEDGVFVGFIMPKYNKTNYLCDVYDSYCDLSFAKRINVAKNICVILDELHRLNYVCGDLNPRNIMFEPDTGYAVFLDADSYHITTPSRTFRCNVCMPDYASKELQIKMRAGLNKAELPTFTKHTDNFALAVHIFQLLMMGGHPFHAEPCGSGIQTYRNIPAPSENILNGFCPFFKTNQTSGKSKFAPDITVLPKKLQDMFYAAFVNGTDDATARPTAEAWYYALNELANGLEQCFYSPNHVYSNHLSQCPWCDLRKQYLQKKETHKKQEASSAPSRESGAVADPFDWNASSDSIEDMLSAFVKPIADEANGTPLTPIDFEW